MIRDQLFNLIHGRRWMPGSLALGILFCFFAPAVALAGQSEATPNTPLVADAATVSPQRITGSFDKEPIRHSDSPARSETLQPTANDTSASSFELPRLLSAMALVIALIFALRWFARRFFGATPISSGTRAVQVLSRSLVAPRQSVVLMRIGRRLLVVADNGSQLSSLSEITDPDEVAALVGQVQGEKLDIAGRTFGAFVARFKKEEAGEAPSAEMLGSVPEQEPTAEPDMSSARSELSGLMEQVRVVSSQFGRT